MDHRLPAAEVIDEPADIAMQRGSIIVPEDHGILARHLQRVVGIDAHGFEIVAAVDEDEIEPAGEPLTGGLQLAAITVQALHLALHGGRSAVDVG